MKSKLYRIVRRFGGRSPASRRLRKCEAIAIDVANHILSSTDDQPYVAEGRRVQVAFGHGNISDQVESRAHLMDCVRSRLAAERSKASFRPIWSGKPLTLRVTHSKPVSTSPR